MSLVSILSSIAPELEAGLTLIGGPFGAVGAMALKAVAGTVTPGDTNPTVDKVLAALQGATPEQLQAIQQANQEFKLKTQQLQIDTIKIKADLEEQESKDDAADRASARQLAITKGIGPQLIISAVFVGGYLAILIARYIGVLHSDASLDAMLQTLLGGVTLILNFWFGSTHGSQKKDAALAQAAVS